MQTQPPECSVKKAVLRNFAKLTVKHLKQSLFFNKVADQRPTSLLKKRDWHKCFIVSFAKFLRTPFYKHLRDDCFYKWQKQQCKTFRKVATLDRDCKKCHVFSECFRSATIFDEDNKNAQIFQLTFFSQSSQVKPFWTKYARFIYVINEVA